MNNDITLADVGLSFVMIEAADRVTGIRKASGDEVRLEFGSDPASKIELHVVRCLTSGMIRYDVFASDYSGRTAVAAVQDEFVELNDWWDAVWHEAGVRNIAETERVLAAADNVLKMFPDPVEKARQS
jgi:hypothetical protein